MIVHVVRPGDTLDGIAREYGVSPSLLQADNRLPDPGRLVTGQTIVVRRPETVYTVRPGDTLTAIAASSGLSVRQLLRLNPILRGEDAVYPGQTIILADGSRPARSAVVTGYAYPFVDRGLLQRTLPYLSALVPFTYGIRGDGSLLPLDDTALIAAAEQSGVTPCMHLSTLTDGERFDSALADRVLNDETMQATLIADLLATLTRRGYRALDVDFEFIPARDAEPYARFITALRRALAPLGAPVIVALAPKTSAEQSGLLYEGHSYPLLGEAADLLLLMTYEWGYTYGPPMAVAPLPNVRQVVEYALGEIPAGKLLLGVPNYGYDWRLPYVRGVSRATSISNQYAVVLASRHNAAISYDETAQSPWFRYRDAAGAEHEVWFEDARSVTAKLSLIDRYGLAGAGYWNLMRPFPQNWLILSSAFHVRDDLSPRS